MTFSAWIRAAIFVVGSTLVIRHSRPWLRDPGSHGFYRAFAFEFLLALFLINVPAWLRTPFSPLQLAAWLLLMLSALLAVQGFAALRRRGKAAAGIETTTVLVTSGMYGYIRHPLYASLLYLGWGMFLKDVAVPPALLIAAASVSIFLTARNEEIENVAKFGSDYVEYMKKTRRFVPFVF
jgi:protein-S-isoprenylcysteine O-methyltransferase Ste14